jgi:nucleotide-binding universal stress UspA family protein
LAPGAGWRETAVMYKAIVVGTDGSETADIAVREAAMLAKWSGATLHIVHAYRAVLLGEAAMAATAGGPMVDIENVNKSISENADIICSAAASTAEREGVTVVGHVVSGDPSDALISVAQEVSADLVVVGNRGMSGKRRFILGSVPNKISHHAPCSVLIVDTDHRA